MGAIFTMSNRNRAGEYHFRRALELHGSEANLFSNLAQNMKNQGRMEESEEYYSKAYELNPKDPNMLFGWIGMEEARQNFDKAWELLDEVESLGKRTAAVALQKAVLLGREKKFSEAIEMVACARTKTAMHAGMSQPAHRTVAQRMNRAQLDLIPFDPFFPAEAL